MRGESESRHAQKDGRQNDGKMECLNDGRGDKGHPVQAVLTLAKSFAGDEAFSDGFVILTQSEVSTQKHALVATKVDDEKDASVLGDFPAFFPLAVQQEVLAQIALAFQPVFQFLKHLLHRTLAGIFQLTGIACGGVPTVEFHDFPFSELLLF